MADIAEETIGGAVSVDIPILRRRRRRRPMLNRVPMHIRVGKEHIYEPVVVPLGLYHRKEHPQKQLLVEPLKKEVQDLVCGGDDRKSLHLSKILERIDDVKHFYGVADGYDNVDELAEMMLQDACWIISFMHNEKRDRIFQLLGMFGGLFMVRDMFMLENQIPLWVISLIHPDQALLCQFFTIQFGDGSSMTQLPWGNGGGDEPLHLLEAFHRLFHDETPKKSCKCFQFIKKYNPLGNKSLRIPWQKWNSLLGCECTASPAVEESQQGIQAHRTYLPTLLGKTPEKSSVGNESLRTLWQKSNSPFWSVTDLQAKGVYFRPSSKCLMDIKFSSFPLYAVLHLPSFFVTNNSKVFLSNLIAFEMSPETDTKYGATSYLNFMKTLINNANDVKVLREKRILYSQLANDEEVLEMFKSIDTYGFSNDDLFNEVKMSVEMHCNSKRKTWIAEFINTYFRNPWTVIALATAIFLLSLTVVQTYYTINPTN